MQQGKVVAAEEVPRYCSLSAVSFVKQTCVL